MTASERPLTTGVRVRRDPEIVPVASVVVPSFRGAARLPALLDSLASQEPGTPAFEVVVVVDGVVDDTLEVLAAEHRLDLRPVVLPENQGRVGALNAGFEAARGDVLIRCDDDLVASPSYVRRFCDVVADGVAAVGLYRNTYVENRYSEVYGSAADENLRRGAYASPDFSWRYWAGNCAISRAMFLDVGEYDARYRLYGWEDVDYGYRLHIAGYAVVLDPGLETTHRVAAVTCSRRAVRAAQSGAARVLFESKFPGSPLPSAVPPRSLWNNLVFGCSVIVGRKPELCGRVVDHVISLLPRNAARRLVGLTVEAAALAGYRHPSRHQEVF